MTRAAWGHDFEFGRTHVRVRKTGALVPYHLSIGKEVLDWLTFFLALTPYRLAGLKRGARRVAFEPDRARPWYLLWAVATVAGARLVSRARPGDILVYFDDSTRGAPPLAPDGVSLINFRCVDVSKSHVAAVFARVAGYDLAIDPAAYHGQAVEKGEDNGAHDGRLVECPCEPKPGRVYQRLIDTLREDGLVEDLRCPTVKGRVPIVFFKRREVERRFANANAQVEMADPATVFSPAELTLLSQFCDAMGLDWGGLDVLRDKRDGRIYVVDVNKTDMGPPTALPLRDKLAATRTLARAVAADILHADP